MLAHAAVAIMGLTAAGAGPSGDSGHPAHIEVDDERGRVTVTIGPLDVLAGMHYHHDGPAEHAGFVWPVDGWMQGYRIDVVGADGTTLPRAMIHHAGVANLSRRQLAYPTAQRLFAVGQETEPVTLPAWMGMRMSAGDELMAYFALVNESGSPVEGAYLRVTLDWRPADEVVYTTPAVFGGRRAHPAHRLRRWRSRVTEVQPAVFDANPRMYEESQFDVGPGVTTVSREVTIPLGGYLRGAGGHMHDYAAEIRLEDAETGEVLVRLEAERTPDGRIRGVGQTVFPFSLRGVRLEAGHRYRVVGVYDNPTGETLPGAGMAYMAGAFVPDDLDRWPELDTPDPRYQADRAAMVGAGAAQAQVAEHGGHGH